MGFDISAAQLSNILIQNKELFYQEKEEIFEVGIKHSDYLNKDDTSSRHNGKNGYCIALGSALFSYFESTNSKSRVNFLQILQGSKGLYVITEECLNYAFEKELSDRALETLEKFEGRQFRSKEAWETFLKKQEILTENDQRTATEAALVCGAFKIGFDLESLPIISDTTPQFSLFLNGLCWVHEERHYRKLIPISEGEREEIEKMRSYIWDFYETLKKIQAPPKSSRTSTTIKAFR